MMDFRNLKKLTIGGVELKQLFVDGIQVWKTGYKNWVKYSTEADGVTIYNGGLGYKNGYRIRSGGAEGEHSEASCTGYIPVNPGDIIRVGGCKWENGTNSAINSYYEDFVHTGQIVGNTTNGYYQYADGKPWEAYNSLSIIHKENYYEWTVPLIKSEHDKYCAYIRITGAVADGAKLIVTINEEIE